MVGRLVFVCFALIALVTFADWYSAPVVPCHQILQQSGQSGKSEQGPKEDCSAGKVVAFWRSAARLVDVWHDDLAAISTIVIAVFTTILGVFTVRLARSTRLAAEAADRSARAAVAIELPFIRPDPPEDLTRVESIEDDRGGLIWDVETPELPEFSRIYELKFRNIGRTTAAPIKLELGWKVALPLPPEEPVFTWSRRCDHGTVIPGDNQPYVFECFKFCIVLTAEERNLIYANTAALWVFGALTYQDFLDESRISRFCWRWGCPDGVGLYYFYTRTNTHSVHSKKLVRQPRAT